MRNFRLASAAVALLATWPFAAAEQTWPFAAAEQTWPFAAAEHKIVVSAVCTLGRWSRCTLGR